MRVRALRDPLVPVKSFTQYVEGAAPAQSWRRLRAPLVILGIALVSHAALDSACRRGAVVAVSKVSRGVAANAR
jgi:hypothetical protein